MAQILWLGALLVATVATIIWPGWPLVLQRLRDRDEWHDTDALRQRARTWPVRFIAATVLVVLLTYAVYEDWPGTSANRPVATLLALIAQLIGLAILSLAMLVSHRDIASRTRAQAIAEARAANRNPTSRPDSDDDDYNDYEYDDTDDDPLRVRTDEFGTAFDTMAVLVTVIAVFVAIGVLNSVVNAASVPQGAVATPDPTVSASDATDQVLTVFNSLHPQYETVEQAPAGTVIVDPLTYAIVDRLTESPRVVWHQSDVLYGGEAAWYLRDADIVVSTLGLDCEALGLIVVETDTTVSIGVIAETPEDAPDTTCRRAVTHSDWFPINLASPLLDRRVQTLDGYGIAYDD